MISVITTLYNYRHFVGDCIRSFIDQKMPEAEMIIVDDCSNDDPYKTVKKYINYNIKYIRLDKNMGYSHAKNVGIKQSSNETIVMLDADDMLSKNSLITRYNKLQEGYDLVHGPAMDLKNGQLSKSALWKKWVTSDKGYGSYKYIHAQSVMLRKQVHREIGLYDESLRYKSDREMWARILNRNYKVGYVDEPVCIYRIHQDQMHKSKQKLLINDKLQKEILNIISNRINDLSNIEMLVGP